MKEMVLPPGEKPISLSYRGPDTGAVEPPPLFRVGPDAGERVRSSFVRACCVTIATALVGAAAIVFAVAGVEAVVVACVVFLPFGLAAVSALLAATLVAFAAGGVVRESCAPFAGLPAPLFAARVLGATSPVLSVLLAYWIAPRMLGRSMDWHEVALLMALPPLLAGWVLARPSQTA